MRNTTLHKRTLGILAPVLLMLAVALAGCPMPTFPGGAVEPEDAEPTATVEPEAESPSEDTGPAGEAGQLPVEEREGMYEAPPPMTIDTDRYYYATLDTEQGEIVVQLFAERAPMTVNNFVFLAEEGFYDDTTFHRVLEDFMAQAGDPTGTGAGGPGYQFQDEFYPGLEFDRPGLLAMANAGPNTNGSQFFITFEPTEWLNGRHTIFGEVIEGMDVLDELTLRDPEQNPEESGDVLNSVTIDVRDESELPTPTPVPPTPTATITPTPTVTPTPYSPESMVPEDLTESDRPLAELSLEERTGVFNTPPEQVIDTGNTYTATISTSQGDLTVALYDDEAPTSVNNFVVLAALGYYDGTPINDVSPEQALIFGAPENVPPSFVGYYLQGELGSERTWTSGALGYIPAPDPATGQIAANGSQILVTLLDPPAEAAQQISFFGEVVDGTDVLNSLTLEDTIESITIQVSEE